MSIPKVDSIPLRLIRASFVISLLIAILGGWQSWQLHHDFKAMSEKHIELTAGVGRIMLLDEALTMSARMAAASSDFSYENRYDKLDQQLSAEIERVRSLLPQAEIARFVGQTDEANSELVKLERQAFKLTHQGQGQQAMALLTGEAYLSLKNIYSVGMEQTRLAASRVIEKDVQYLWLLTIVLVLSCIIGVLVLMMAWFFAMRSVRKWDVERQIAQSALRAAHDELEAQVVQRTAQLQGTNEALEREIVEHKLVEAKILRMNSLYSALSQCNHAIVHCDNEAELFAQLCRTAVQLGGMKMSWIGSIDEGRAVCRASCGEGGEDLEEIWLAEDGVIGAAIRNDQPCWCQNIMTDPAARPWVERATRFGWGALASLPLRCNGELVGVFNLYAGVADAFDEAARSLLVEMSMDISFALGNYAREQAHQQARERVENLVHFDQLTGLPNHTLFNDRIKFAIMRAQRSEQPLSVLFLDLDHFKHINDTLGHGVGNEVLTEVARRIKLALRDEDTVSRQGGDEFVIVLPDADASGAAHVAQKLLGALAQVYSIGPHALNITVSIGIAVYPFDGDNFESLFKCVEVAMYRAKHDGRNNYRFFTQEMQQNLARILRLENALHYALELGQLQLNYQPQMRAGKIVGAEALLRWTHPELGAVSPAEFVPVAEANGQIVQIGEWVLRTAVSQLKTWMDSGLAPMVIAVNLSAVQFRHANLPGLVTQILDEVGLSPEYLELELTEGVAMDDPQGAIAVMDNLHERGIRMSIDDFGTGYSSLSYLKKFKVYKLKIDQSFVRNLTDDQEDKAIISAIISLAASLGMQTIAEGVETAGQLAFLHNQGCNEVQGYYYSRPLPSMQFEAFVRALV